MRLFVMFITAVFVIFLVKLRWPKKKRIYDVILFYFIINTEDFHHPRATISRNIQFFSLSQEAAWIKKEVNVQHGVNTVVIGNM